MVAEPLRDLTFSNSEELEAWLKDKPPAWAQAIATRAALRVFPLTFSQPPKLGRQSHSHMLALALAVFRAGFISWSAGYYPDHDMGHAAAAATVSSDISDAAVAASADAVTVAAINASYAVAASAASYTDAASATSYSDATAANFAAAAASAAYYASYATDDATATAAFWKSATADALWLSEKIDSEALIKQPLWLNDVRGDLNYKVNFPLWVRTPFDAFAKSKRGQGDWSTIINWYRAILPNASNRMPVSMFGEEIDVALALQPDAFWEIDEETSPDQVVARINELIHNPKAFPRRENKSKSDWHPELTHKSRIQKDGPTREDELGRTRFAASLIDMLDEALTSNEGGGEALGFAVNLHAPWGAGKTSVLKMMEESMGPGPRNRDDGWTVVWFNAWRHERRNPPWWAMMEAVRAQTLQRLDNYYLYWRSFLFRNYWRYWRLRFDYAPLMIAIIAVVALSLFLMARPDIFGNLDDLEKFLYVISASIVVSGFLAVAVRALLFGSDQHARFYFELTKDPLGRIGKLFARSAKIQGRPICVFIDDLDRCNADYVVDLLEGIQTAFRNHNTVYVVAADRKWIKAAFEARYKNNFAQVETPGQPLGHLFLEKIFQVSAPLPAVSAAQQEQYLNNRLGDEAKPSAEAADDLEAEADDIQAGLDENLQGEALDDLRRRVQGAETEIEKEAAALAGARSEAVQREREHQLKRFGAIIPFNPRAIKRLINAYNLRAGPEIISHKDRSDALARWVVLEQAYPGLVDLLVEEPNRAAFFLSEEPDVSSDPVLESFMGDDAIYRIFSDTDESVSLGKSLTPEMVQLFTQCMR